MSDFVHNIPATITLVYLAGPYRGAVRQNVRNAEAWAVKCAKKGIGFICPHLNSAFMSEGTAPDAPADFWLEMDRNIVARVDAVLLLPGWEDSMGAAAEKVHAEKRGIPCYEIEDFFDMREKEWEAEA